MLPTTVLLALATTPAQAAGSAYVALGDSYSSGTGTRSYLSEGRRRDEPAARRSGRLDGVRHDAGFSAVLTECPKPAWGSNCNGAIDRAQSISEDLHGGGQRRTRLQQPHLCLPRARRL